MDRPTGSETAGRARDTLLILPPSHPFPSLQLCLFLLTCNIAATRPLPSAHSLSLSLILPALPHDSPRPIPHRVSAVIISVPVPPSTRSHFPLPPGPAHLAFRTLCTPCTLCIPPSLHSSLLQVRHTHSTMPTPWPAAVDLFLSRPSFRIRSTFGPTTRYLPFVLLPGPLLSSVHTPHPYVVVAVAVAVSYLLYHSWVSFCAMHVCTGRAAEYCDHRLVSLVPSGCRVCVS